MKNLIHPPFKRRTKGRTIALVLCTVYLAACCFLRVRQRYLIYRPQAELALRPSTPDFNLPYEEVWIPISGSSHKLHGWWLPENPVRPFVSLPDEPAQILTSPKVLLYFCGVGNNKGDYNYLARASAFRQLGFSVLMVDYRGYGLSKGNFPDELQLYEDAQLAWNYLRNVKKLSPEQIVLYGESLGGAIALDLATKHPNAAGLVMQSSFTSMADAIDSRPFTKIFPIKRILTEQFDSLVKIRSLQIPVLFLHGSKDSVVPTHMSQQLYAAAPHPKQLFIIPNADHVSIYQPREASYLKALQRFMTFVVQ